MPLIATIIIIIIKKKKEQRKQNKSIKIENKKKGGEVIRRVPTQNKINMKTPCWKTYMHIYRNIYVSVLLNQLYFDKNYFYEQIN